MKGEFEVLRRANDGEPLRDVMPPPPVAPASPVMIAPNIARGMRKLFTTLFSVLTVIADGIGKLFATPLAVFTILFSALVAKALYDHVNYAYQLGPTGGYGPDSDAYGSFFGTGFSFLALVFALLNFFFHPRSKVGLIILVWCGLLVVGFMTLRPRF